jgi:hypothetical protein
VWFRAQGDTVSLSLNTSRQKTKNLIAKPAVNLADQVGAKYESDLRLHDQPGQSRVKVTIKPVRINAVNMQG